MEQTVSLAQVLQAREDRALHQRQLLERYGRPLVCFTMNIAGPVKNSGLICRGFALGCRLLEQQLRRAHAPVLHREHRREMTGCEAYYVADLPAEQLKALTMELEEGTEAGRLFDMDVLDPGGKKLDRPQERSCLICGRPGRGCARSRAHTVEQLQQRTTQLLQQALDRDDRRRAAELACRALLFEVCNTPKPGLVDRNNSGSHDDMDIYTFLSSTAALWPYFETCTAIGQETAQLPPTQTLSRLRLPGKLAENAMLEATGGVNTHKGAIFSMGILCGALGRLERRRWKDPEAVLQMCAAMAEGLPERDFAGLSAATAVTAGERLFVRCGVTGIRGQMAAGLPSVRSHGLPALRQALAEGKTADQAGTAALLALLASTEDTNLLSRGGAEGLRWARAAALREPDPAKLDMAFVEKNLSPGGCADLLSVCWMLQFLSEEAEMFEE